jgi:hypothetical protein
VLCNMVRGSDGNYEFMRSLYGVDSPQGKEMAPFFGQDHWVVLDWSRAAREKELQESNEGQGGAQRSKPRPFVTRLVDVGDSGNLPVHRQWYLVVLKRMVLSFDLKTMRVCKLTCPHNMQTACHRCVLSKQRAFELGVNAANPEHWRENSEIDYHKQPGIVNGAEKKLACSPMSTTRSTSCAGLTSCTASRCGSSSH